MVSRKIRFVPGYPDIPFDVAGALRSACEKAQKRLVARLGFAYATNSGLDALLATLGDMPAWQGAAKEWLVGLHHGITEPKALERIRGMSNSRVRVFVGGNRLSASNLLCGKLFHPKVINIASRSSRSRPVLMLASSANLTGAALAPDARNYEAGIALYGSAISRREHARFLEWWHRGWAESLEVTDALLDSYTKLRDRFLVRNPDLVVGLDPPSISHLSDADTLWIEAGAMSGGSRNQVEFNEELAAFFGPVERRTRVLRIKANGKEWDDRPLSHKVTTFGVHIWRLSLPTEGSGGFEYPSKVIRLRKAQDREGVYFVVDVAEPDGSTFARWRSTAHRRGYLGITSGQRAFGFWLMNPNAGTAYDS